MTTGDGTRPLNRRELLKTAGAGSTLVGASSALPLVAAENQPLPQRELGKLRSQLYQEVSARQEKPQARLHRATVSPAARPCLRLAKLRDR